VHGTKAALQHAFSACVYCMQSGFKSNYFGLSQTIYYFFENATACRKRTLKTCFAMLLKALKQASKSANNNSNSMNRFMKIKFKTWPWANFTEEGFIITFMNIFLPNSWFLRVPLAFFCQWINTKCPEFVLYVQNIEWFPSGSLGCNT